MDTRLLSNFITENSLTVVPFIRPAQLSYMTSIVIQSRRWTAQSDSILALGAKPGAADPGAEMALEAGRAGAHQSNSQPPIRPERSRERG